MVTYSPNFIKNFLLARFLNTKLYFIREKSDITNFPENFKNVKKILIILPRDRAEEVNARKYIPEFNKIFDSCRISKLDIFNLDENDKNWLGAPNKFYLSKIKNEKFDLSVDLNSSHDILCTFLTAKAGAPLRIHLAQGKFDKIYNIQIRSEFSSSLHARFKLMIGYLATMRQIPAYVK
jgi:hypothetical protein